MNLSNLGELMKFVEVLKECEQANGAGSKKVIQAAIAKLDAVGRKLMRYAMDPYMTFGVKKFDRPTVYAAQDPSDISGFFGILDSLARREITGNAARNAVTAALTCFTKETATYLERVLEQDLKAGFSSETFNKVWKDEPIPVFNVMLAEKCATEEDFDTYVTFPCQGDIKYDGTRQIAIVREGQPVDYRARSGKVSEHLNGLFDDELQAIRAELGYDFVLDGETLGASFTQTMNAKKSGNTTDKNALIFRCFFLMPLSDWTAQKTTITMRQARDQLEQLLEGKQKLLLTKGKELGNYAEMMEYCNEVIDDESAQPAEREGLILKQLDATYEWDRSYAWVKVKRFYDVDARIIGFYAGRPKTRFAEAGVPGGAHCVAFLESGERVEFNVGSGFSDEDRHDMVKNPEKWLKATHVIKYQEVSRAKNKEVASLRFCTYERSRDDKLVEV